MPNPAAKSSPTDFAADVQAGDAVMMRNIALRYDQGPEVLSDLDLDLRRGEFAFLTGASGSGKSSLIRLIHLTLSPARGLYSLFGQDTLQLTRAQRPILRRRVGVVLQEFALIDHLSVFENVALPLRVTGARRSQYTEDALELLNWVGLGDRLDSLPPTLSGGEKQRVAIARAVISRPDLLIADEPTGNVDPEMGARLIRLFAEMNKLGTTVLIATHDLDLIPRGARRLKLKDGKLIGGVKS